MKKLAIISILLAATLSAVEFMDVDQIKPGMQGVGKTVFQGTKIEDFSVEILGVMKKVNPHSDIILAKLSGGPLEKTGVISGMSGSPVYINGKLIGALAYAYGPFSKEPIAGITPIKEMLEVLNRKDTDKPQDFSLKKIEIGAAGFQPLQIPVTISAADEQLFSMLPKILPAAGLVPVAGGGETKAASFTLEPGAAVGVQLVKGDLDLTAMGTLTYIDGDKILAFGHNLFSGGSVDLPLCGGFVYAILPSQNQSYKMVSPLETIGRVFQDRRAGIAAVIGASPKLIPFSVSVKSEAATQNYQYAIIDHKLLTPNLIGLCCYWSIQSTERILGSATIKYAVKLNLKNKPRFERRNMFSGNDAPGEVMDATAADLSTLLNNPLEAAEVTSGQLELEISETPKTAEIQRVYVAEDIVKPGAELQLTVFVKPLGGASQTKTVKLTLPRQLPAGDLDVLVSQADSAMIYERKLVPGKYAPENFNQLLDLMKQRSSNNEIVVSVFSAGEGATTQGRELPALPPSIVSVLRRSKADGEFQLTDQTLVLRETIPTDYVIKGSAYLTLHVER
jgi:hypothetical protein